MIVDTNISRDGDTNLDILFLMTTTKSTTNTVIMIPTVEPSPINIPPLLGSCTNGSVDIADKRVKEYYTTVYLTLCFRNA